MLSKCILGVRVFLGYSFPYNLDYTDGGFHAFLTGEPFDIAFSTKNKYRFTVTKNAAEVNRKIDKLRVID